MTAAGHFKAECPYCGQHVEVPEELASEWIPCPNEACAKSFPPIVKHKHGTPPAGFTPKDILAVTVNKPSAGQIEARKHAGTNQWGIEDNLELLGNVLLGLCVLAAFFGLVVFFVETTTGGKMPNLAVCIAVAVALLLQGWIARVFFYALAEIIRQLRKLNNRT